MKRMLSAFVLFFFSQFSFAQSISMDSSFSGDGTVMAGIYPWESQSKFIAVQSDGKLIMAGAFPGFNIGTLKRFNLDGSLDSTFQFANSADRIEAICLDEDEKIICSTNNGLTRLHNNGIRDTTFVTSQDSSLAGYTHTETAILPNGKIVSCGFQHSPLNVGFYIAAYNPDGTPDSTFAQTGIFKYHPTEIDLVFSLKFQEDGKIIVSGCSMTQYPAIITLYRLTTEGVLDSTFGDNGVIKEPQFGGGEGFDLAIQPDGKIVVTGYAFLIPAPVGAILRYMPNGERDTSFGINGARFISEISSIGGLILRPNAKIIVNGITTNDSRGALIQLLSDGTLDTNFGENGIFYTSLANEIYRAMSIHAIGSNKIAISSSFNAPLIPGSVLNQYILQDLNVGTLSPKGDFAEKFLVYPNPIANDFMLKFSLTRIESISIALFDMNGKLIKNLAQERLFDAGEYNEIFHLGQEIPASNYFLTVFIKGKPVSSVQIIKK